MVCAQEAHVTASRFGDIISALFCHIRFRPAPSCSFNLSTFHSAPGSPCRRAIRVGAPWWFKGHALQHPGLHGMQRGDDFFRQHLGRPEDLDAKDIPLIAELDSDAWRGFG